MSTRPCRRDVSADPRLIGAKNGLQDLAVGGIWSRRSCIMSVVMPGRRKINTRAAGRTAALVPMDVSSPFYEKNDHPLAVVIPFPTRVR